MCFEDPEQNELYYQVSEDSLQQLSASPEITLEIIQNEELDVLEEGEDASDDNVVEVLSNGLEKLKIAEFKERNYCLVNISFSDEEAHKKYVYYFHCDKLEKKMHLIFTRNQRKYHPQVLQKLQEFANKQNYTLEAYCDFTRVLFINSCPEIFLAFCLQKVIEEGASFMEVFRTLAFNTVPFILDDPESSEVGLSSDQGLPSNLDSAKSKCFV
jgi:predicted ATPase